MKFTPFFVHKKISLGQAISIVDVIVKHISFQSLLDHLSLFYCSLVLYKVIFYTEILTGKVVLWCFFSSETIQLFKSKSQYKT